MKSLHTEIYQPTTSRLIAMFQLAFGAALLVSYGAGLLFATALPVISIGSLAIIAFIGSAAVQWAMAPAAKQTVWAFAGVSILLFSFIIWSIALLYYGKVPAALQAPTYLFVFPLLVLYGFYSDEKLILFSGGVAAGARLAIDLMGVLGGDTFTTSYAWAVDSHYLSISGEIECLVAIGIFTLCLALLIQKRATAADPEQSDANSAAASVINADGKTSILIAEDSAINMMVLSNMLSDKRFELIMTEDGREAVEVFRRMATEGNPPDIVLLDIEMPEMDGCEAARAIRACEAELGLTPRPVIAVTALGQEENRLASLDAGMDDHLVKPVQRPVLLSSIAHALSRYRRG